MTLTPIEAIQSGIRSCTACNLHETARAPVAGTLETGVGVALIGEAPGRQEDQQGRPFIGPAGRLLVKTLNALKMNMADMALINTVCCRPPGNDYGKAAKAGAVRACDPWFKMQLEASGAWIVVPMGNSALSKFSDEKIGKVRGKAFWLGSHLILPTWHPAYVLRNPDARMDLAKDFRQLREILKGEAEYPKPVNYEPTIPLNALRRPPPYSESQKERFRLHFKSKRWVYAYSHWLEDHIILVQDEGVQVPKEVKGVRYMIQELVQLSHMERNWEDARRLHIAKKKLNATLL